MSGNISAMNSTEKQESGSKKLFALDVIRVVAMLLVVVYHVSMSLREIGADPSNAVIDFGRNVEFGFLGTLLFMILSGYTSFYSYKRIEAKGAKKVAEYYKKRLLAIFPAYFVAYFLAFLAIRLPHRFVDSSIIYTLFGMDGYLSAHGVHTCYLVGEWFTGCILLLYLLFPLIHLAAEKLPIPTLIFALAVKVVSAPILYITGILDCSVLVCLSEFILGVLIAKYVKRVRLVPGLVSLAVFLVMIFVPIPLNHRYNASIMAVSGFLTLLFAFSALENSPVFQKKFFTVLKSVVSTVSKYSFAVFLTHHVLIDWLYRNADPNMGPLKWLGYFIVVMILTGLTSFIVQTVADAVRKRINRLFQPKPRVQA